MVDRVKVTGATAADRIAEIQRPLLWLTSFYKRLKKDKFTGEVILRFAEGELCDSCIKDQESRAFFLKKELDTPQYIV